MPLELQAGDSLTWTVELANIKQGVQRPNWPPEQPERPVLLNGSDAVRIEPDPCEVSGAGQSREFFDTDDFLGSPVSLGELRTDNAQNLIVIGGAGKSESPLNPPAPIVEYYTNPGWYDDVADGPVKVKIRRANGQEITAIAPAWVITGPPNFAPLFDPIVSLYEIIYQVGVDHHQLPDIGVPNFTRDIFPLLRKASNLQWVHDDDDPHNVSDEQWAKISTDWESLAREDSASADIRRDTWRAVQRGSTALRQHRLTDSQQARLREWRNGNFEGGWNGIPEPGSEITAEGMTQAALEQCIGQGFGPGIEAGIILMDHTLYDSSGPFDYRVDHNQISAGFLTALMAVPWQADFRDCKRRWWPTQRPDKARMSGAPYFKRWARGIDVYEDMVEHFGKLGYLKAEEAPAGSGEPTIVYVEEGRDPSLPEVPDEH